jgi:hypothetical protein
MDLGEIGGMRWIGSAEDSDQWKALVKVVINIRIP